MVYEAREGEVILLGASAWRIEQITHDRVLVSPAPGEPGKVPFWKGEGAGPADRAGPRAGRVHARDRRGGRAGSAGRRRRAKKRLRDDHDLDELAARNLLDYLAEEQPGDRRPADRPDDRPGALPRRARRLAHLPADAVRARVHAPWALAIEARLREPLGLEVQPHLVATTASSCACR